MKFLITYIYPANQFLPSPGQITYLHEPSGPGIRLDSGVYESWTVPLDYDPLLAKLIAWAPSREHAIGRLDAALVEYAIGGIRTNTAFFRQILADPDFRAGRLSTDFLVGHALASSPEVGVEAEAAAAIAVALEQSPSAPAVSGQGATRWLTSGRESQLR